MMDTQNYFMIIKDIFKGPKTIFRANPGLFEKKLSQNYKMKILLASNKYHPEYSGSGLRAHNTYKRLKKKYKIEFNVLSNSIALIRNKNYLYDGIEINRISQPFTIPSKKSFWQKILIIFAIFWQIFFSWKYIRKKIETYDLIHTFGNTYSIGFLSWYFSKKTSNKRIM